MAYISFTCQVNTTILPDASVGRKDQELRFVGKGPRLTNQDSLPTVGYSALPLQASPTNHLPAVTGRGEVVG